jgi:uncharacterized repeat protein (TIGR02543 family)
MKRSFITILLAVLLCSFIVSGCAARGDAADPGAWGYECMVTYDALGGIINAREVRKTYYLPNSYVFMPSGSSNMLVEPVKDGYILVGWYTAKSEAPEGSNEVYQFKATDRWDFSTDRVQSGLSLYARWLPRGKVNYVDASTGDVLFAKNITAESPIQPLSESVLVLHIPEGTSFAGYYADAACTTEYNFSSDASVNPTPSEGELYTKLFQMFPQYLEAYEYIEPSDTDQEADEDFSWLFLNKLGFRLKTNDPEALKELADAKDALVEESIQNYLTGTANKVIYLKFIEEPKKP